jgi:hypothetical protein
MVYLNKKTKTATFIWCYQCYYTQIIGMYTLPDQEASFPNPNFSRRALLRAFT